MFKLIARRRKDNVDEFLYTFYDERQFYYMLNQVDKEKYKEASILEYENEYSIPVLKMYCEFKKESNIKRRRK